MTYKKIRSLKNESITDSKSKKNDDNRTPPVLPARYRTNLFLKEIDFYIPEFKKSYPKNYSKCLALRDRECDEWFEEFAEKVSNAIGRKYLPIMRISDGEFLFILGGASPDFRISFMQKLRVYAGNLKRIILKGGGISAFTQGHYHSGEYSSREWKEARTKSAEMIKNISEEGILALHLNYVDTPFTERYFPIFGRWIKDNSIRIDDCNYYPFYFVYALLIGSKRSLIFKNKNILVVNSAEGDKKSKIIKSIINEGAAKVFWCPISSNRSLYDQIQVNDFVGKIDIALIGAGIGKGNIIQQCKILNVPCIDAGFIFEIWFDKNNSYKRVYCATDDDWLAIKSSPSKAGIL
jgi:hypothetical protein